MDALTLLAVGSFAGGLLFWLDSARAREIATRIAREYCRRRGMQLLDGSAALARIRLQRRDGRLRWQRTFQFDYVEESTVRRRGVLVLNGRDLQDFMLEGDSIDV